MPRLVRGCLEDVAVVDAVHLEHEHGPVRKVPLGIGPSTSTRSIPTTLLASGGCDPEVSASAAEVDLRQRVRAAGDVVQQGPDLAPPPQWRHPRKPFTEPIRRGEALLDGGRDRTVCGPATPLI